MAGTSGLCSDANGVAAGVMDYLTGKTTTAPTLTANFKVAFLTSVRTANNGSDTEWSTGGGYTQTAGGSTGGVSLPAASMNSATSTTTGAAATNGTAVSVTNAPAGTWAGNRIQDSTATTNKNVWYGTIGTAKTIAAGDSCTLPSSTGIQTALG